MLPNHELRAILTHVIGYYCQLEECSAEQQKRIETMVKQRKTGMPLAKILGIKEFWKHRFITTQDTLDPRPDSETLIEAVLKTCPIRPWRILDLGTGTGCLLISLLEEYPQATGTGVDMCPKALGVAQQNSVILKKPTTWILSNWCEKLSGSFDIIVANPPYIHPSEPINEGATFDPPLALYGGIHTYEAILKSIDRYLTVRPSYLFFEIGYTQAKEVSLLLQNYGYHNIQSIKDLSGHERVLIARTAIKAV